VYENFAVSWVIPAASGVALLMALLMALDLGRSLAYLVLRLDVFVVLCYHMLGGETISSVLVSAFSNSTAARLQHWIKADQQNVPRSCRHWWPRAQSFWRFGLSAKCSESLSRTAQLTN
jgi:hypothetical protein